MKNGNKYINRYPEGDLVQILKESKYHSSEWEETDPEEEQEEIEDEITITGETKKNTSLYIYEKWWRSSAVCIFYNFTLLNINANLFYFTLFI
jgi:hypothetical protein